MSCSPSYGEWDLYQIRPTIEGRTVQDIRCYVSIMTLKLTMSSLHCSRQDLMYPALNNALHRLFAPAVPLVRFLGSSWLFPASRTAKLSAPGTARTNTEESVSKATS